MAVAGWSAGRQTIEVAADRVDTANTHGTGRSVSSAMATSQARLGSWSASLSMTKSWVQESLEHADELEVGTGRGPIHHFHRLWASGPPQGCCLIPGVREPSRPAR
ncbi:bifunctional hydroxymethylpyrimidine kinase/phosphomethylpyrimidine kinase [Cryobacterium sp. Hz9]|uniref:bifunctional hydroxymethylpyrimidine kinase/phosphomethylpyrimidine kinase n=1 Tax=Cryobacterium sp. Hz9 TaxID=1259167 RepID=UPI002106189D|nr:bifunctional hydroxymethylpyrimidine kinase/phosphomethylpyrimidine kinase [Cryobacterium sp. Hz9]